MCSKASTFIMQVFVRRVLHGLVLGMRHIHTASCKLSYILDGIKFKFGFVIPLGSVLLKGNISRKAIDFYNKPNCGKNYLLLHQSKWYLLSKNTVLFFIFWDYY